MESIYEDMHFQAMQEIMSLNDRIMEFREKLPEDLKKEYDILFNIGTPTEKLNKLANGTS